MAYRSGFPLSPAGVPGIFSLRREIDRLFEDAFDTQGGSRGTTPSFTPAADAREDAREITLHLDLPGVRPEDVDISVENGLLTVRGQRHQQRKEGQEGRYHFVERSYGSFTRAFQLPQGVDESQIRADFEHGELVVHVPKPALPQPRKVQIGVGGATAHGASANGSQTNGARAPEPAAAH
ncbi:MAG TPA: Hsp20/alpha crystallin family protein [Gemmatirosa sp.]